MKSNESMHREFITVVPINTDAVPGVTRHAAEAARDAGSRDLGIEPPPEIVWLRPVVGAIPAGASRWPADALGAFGDDLLFLRSDLPVRDAIETVYHELVHRLQALQGRPVDGPEAQREADAYAAVAARARFRGLLGSFR